jgi:hypothetical protein
MQCTASCLAPIPVACDGDIHDFLQPVFNAARLTDLSIDPFRMHILKLELFRRIDWENDHPLTLQILEQCRQADTSMASACFEYLPSQARDSEQHVAFLIMLYLKLEELLAELAEAQLQEIFTRQKQKLQRVILSRIVVEERGLAEQLKDHLRQHPHRFTQLAKMHSVVPDSQVGGRLKPLMLKELPEAILHWVATAREREILGPIQVQDTWCLVRVEAFLPTSLNHEPTRQYLKQQLFREWLDSKVSSIMYTHFPQPRRRVERKNHRVA